MRKLSVISSPAAVGREIGKESVRKKFLENLRNLSGEPLITLEGAKYVISNMVRKRGTDRIILHFVNYSEHLKNVKVKVNLDGYVGNINKERVKLYSPDNVSRIIKDITVNDKRIEFTMPSLKIYNVVVIN